MSPNRRVALVSVPLAGGGTDDTSFRALAALRDDVIPATVGRVDGVEAAVTGETAVSKDFNDLMAQRMPLVVGFVLLLAFGLLLVAFRSIVIAAKAIVLNLLSVAAAYGLLVAVFQWGWGESILGFDSTGAITAWLPLFMFVILFGLSMDYHVFILSRVREAYDRGMSTEDAVAHGIKATAGVVTAAATVMVAVFAIFVTLSTVDMKQLGFGLATAILIDATIVRARPAPGGDEAAGRLELVPAALAPLAPRARARAGAGGPAGSGLGLAHEPFAKGRRRPRLRGASVVSQPTKRQARASETSSSGPSRKRHSSRLRPVGETTSAIDPSAPRPSRAAV